MPSLQDLVPGFDPTGYTEITGAQLLQLMTGTVPYGDKGLTLMTADLNGNPLTPVVPDANTNTKWQNYLWIRQLATGVFVYVWNPAATNDATYQKWQSITVSSILPDAVGTINIQTGAVTDDKIASVSWGKVTGAPDFIASGDAAGGDLTGTFPNPTIAVNAVDRTKLKSDAVTDANRAVGTDHIQDGAVTLAKLGADVTAQIAPIGAIFPFAATTIPSGWAACDGSVISRATYPTLNALFAADDYVWGAGNGTTTFALPDLRGQFIRGWSSGASVDPDGPRTVGNHQNDAVKTHTHDVVIGSDNATDTQQTLAIQGDNTTHTTFTSSNQQPAGATETRPKNYAVIFIIKIQ